MTPASWSCTSKAGWANEYKMMTLAPLHHTSDVRLLNPKVVNSGAALGFVFCGLSPPVRRASEAATGTPLR
jgi:hypothetical protein